MKKRTKSANSNATTNRKIPRSVHYPRPDVNIRKTMKFAVLVH